jgi:cell division protein FtsB
VPTTFDEKHAHASSSKSVPATGAKPRVQTRSRGFTPSRPVRHLGLAAALVILGGLVGVLPFGTRAAQNETFVLSKARLAQLKQENAALTAQRDLLQTDQEVARIAREEFGLAPQDATVYAIPDLRSDNADRAGIGVNQPVPTTVVPVSPVPKQGFGSRVIDVLVFWD